MRKTIMCFFIIAIVSLSACTSAPSVLETATGIPGKQLRMAERILRENEVIYTSAKPSNNSAFKGMDSHFFAFDLEDDKGNTHLLILRKEDGVFLALLNCEAELITGMIDGGVTPTLFE